MQSLECNKLKISLIHEHDELEWGDFRKALFLLNFKSNRIQWYMVTQREIFFYVFLPFIHFFPGTRTWRFVGESEIEFTDMDLNMYSKRVVWFIKIPRQIHKQMNSYKTRITTGDSKMNGTSCCFHSGGNFKCLTGNEWKSFGNCFTTSIRYVSV